MNGVSRPDLLRFPSSVVNGTEQIINYTPPLDRERPTLLELPLLLPPKSTVELSIEFEKVFLKYTEHPPDAQRGWDLPGAVVIPYVLPSDDFSKMEEPEMVKVGMPDGTVKMMPRPGPKETPLNIRVYSNALLADLATPDFSMPYNVIIMSGGLVALLFGLTFNMLMRKFVLVKT